MSFKSLLLALMAVTLATGCSLRFNDKVTKATTSVSTGTDCLLRTGEVLNRFSEGTLTENEHATYFACLHQALNKFTGYTSGKNQDYFTPRELAGFLTKYFLAGKEIQPALLDEAVALKQAILGGPADRLSRHDLEQLDQLFENLRSFTASLRPLMPLSAASFVERGFDSDRVEDALKQVISAVSRFGGQLKGKQSSYTFDHLQAYVRELSAFLYRGQSLPEDHWSVRMGVFSEALRPVKAILLSPPRNEITVADWPKVYRLAPRFFASYLRVQFHLQSPRSSLHGNGLKMVERIFSDFTNTFEFVLEQQPGHVITSEEIDDLILTFYKQNLLPCRPNTARQFIKVVFGKLLGSAADPKKFAITKESLSHLRENVHFAIEGLHAAEALYRTKYGDQFADGVLSKDEIDSVSETQLLEATTLKSTLSREAVKALKRTPIEVRTVFAASGGLFNVVIPKKGDVLQFSYMHMVKMLAMRSFNRLLVQGFGNPRKAMLTATELDSLVSDIFPIMRELRLVNKDMRASISKRLFEASLFLYSSDGDRGLTMNEGLELEALILSTLERSPKAHEKLATLCKASRLDANQKLLIPGACYRREFLKKSREIWNYLPGLADYMAALSPENQRVVFGNMEHFLRKGAAASDDFTLADTQSFVLFPYYIELLFSRFDKNHDGVLDNAEAAVAYPVFQPFIAEKARSKGYTDPKDHVAIFNFLLAYQMLPTDDKWDFVIRRYMLGPKEFRVDRSQVVEIFEKLMSL